MIWDYVTFNSLIKIVYEKYNTQFWGRPDDWESYLTPNGIVREERRKPLEQDGEIQIECPWSVVQSINPSKKKVYLSIPKHIAEKIVVFELMP